MRQSSWQVNGRRVAVVIGCSIYALLYATFYTAEYWTGIYQAIGLMAALLIAEFTLDRFLSRRKE